jgi:hypothetical protein
VGCSVNAMDIVAIFAHCAANTRAMHEQSDAPRTGFEARLIDLPGTRGNIIRCTLAKEGWRAAHMCHVGAYGSGSRESTSRLYR